MCGISGLMSLSGVPIIPADVRNMVSALGHRGPDGDGVFCTELIGLGHKRLAIFDLSSAGHQPMCSRCERYTIIHNGEVYNWPEIRSRLSFSSWRTKTDTETILEAFAELGTSCLELLNGMFAFSIWDKKEQKLFMARDRVGIKPLLYGLYDGRFYFASEAKAILSAGFPKKYRETAIYDYLRWGAIDHSTETFFDGIMILPPGHWMSVSTESGISLQKYWDLEKIVHSSPVMKMDDAVQRYEELLRESIALQARSDVPVAAFLSGGVDSSIVTSQLVKSGVGGLCAFTYDFDTGGGGESVNAGRVAKILEIDHERVELGHADVPNYFEKVLFHQESPFTSMRVLAVHKLYELCQERGFKVILEGQGGDQLGAGFEYYWMAVVMDALCERGPQAAANLVNAFFERFNVKKEVREQRLLQALGAIIAQGTATQDGCMFVRPELLNREFLARNAARGLPINRTFSSHLLNTQYNDFKGGNLQRVLRYADRASMSTGCEARVPILDHNIVELCFCSPPAARVNGVEQRYLMREAARKLLPASILESPKRSVVDPQRAWLKDELHHWVLEILHSSIMDEFDFLDVEGVRAEYNAYCAMDGMPPSGFHIFQYVNIALWYDKVIKGNLLTDGITEQTR